MGKESMALLDMLWFLHTFDMDSLVGIVNSFLSNFWSMLCITKRKEKRRWQR